ncbi:hypothetical protein BH23CHL7_BH23CHL7_19200 [soil metagenome]
MGSETAPAACCSACSESPAPIKLERPSAGRPPRRRGASERTITLAAIGLAGAFVGAALATMVVGPPAGLAVWLPLHLLLAGAAPTAIAGVMPYFSSAVAGAPPAQPVVRIAGIAGVAAGAVLVTGGLVHGATGGPEGGATAAIGGVIYIGGLLAVAGATLLPLRAALGPRRLFIGAVYGLALANVIIGASLATLFVASWQPVLAAWASLKPAHAWLNIFGFLSLVIAGSLLHLLPTVVGARIRRTVSSIVAFTGLAFGPAVVALGFAIAATPLALAGGALVLAAAAALAWHAITVMRARASWTTDPGWHRMATWSLLAAIAWFGVGAARAAGQLLTGGIGPSGWQMAPLIGPLAIGWVAQVLVGSWTHLLPAIGPGSPEQHARQRQILGHWATVRLALLNGGLVAIVVADAVAMPVLRELGLVGVGAAGAMALALLVAAIGLVPLARRQRVHARGVPSGPSDIATFGTLRGKRG